MVPDESVKLAAGFAVGRNHFVSQRAGERRAVGMDQSKVSARLAQSVVDGPDPSALVREEFTFRIENQVRELRAASPGKVSGTLFRHVNDRYWNSMRYFGLLAPRSKTLLTHVFSVLKQEQKPRPVRLRYAESIYRTFGQNPLIGLDGQPLFRVGHIKPLTPA